MFEPVWFLLLSGYQLFHLQDWIGVQSQLNLTFKDIKLTVSTQPRNRFRDKELCRAWNGWKSHKSKNFWFLCSLQHGVSVRPHFAQPRLEYKAVSVMENEDIGSSLGPGVPLFSVNLSHSLICIRSSLCLVAFYKLKDGHRQDRRKLDSLSLCKLYITFPSVVSISWFLWNGETEAQVYGPKCLVTTEQIPWLLWLPVFFCVKWGLWPFRSHSGVSCETQGHLGGSVL